MSVLPLGFSYQGQLVCPVSSLTDFYRLHPNVVWVIINILKSYQPSCGFKAVFFETELNDFFKKYDIQAVEVLGVCTNICVMDTVGGLANRDYTITVPRAGVADFDPEFHEFALKRMDKIYGAKVQ